MEDTKALLEIYKLYVQSAESTSDRRGRTNSFYLVLCSTLITVFGTLTKLQLLVGLYSVLLGLLGLLFSVVWYFNIQSYRQINSGKFKVIHDLEKELPFACFTEEWKALGHIGNKQKTYRLLTSVEKYVPFIFGVGFIIITIISYLS